MARAWSEPGRRRRSELALLTASLLQLASACSERVPSAPRAATSLTGRVLDCQADVGAGTLVCAPPSATRGGSGASQISADVILGGQGIYVQLSSSNVSYDATNQIFQADVTVQNLTPLMLGTPDGNTVTGVKVFFHSGPSVVSGSGAVSVANADGVGTFTGSNQPFFLYPEILPQGQVSAAKTWQWAVPSTVGRFVFQVLVDAAAPVETFFKLTVSVLGEGTVTSTPVGISCNTGNSGVCSALFLPGTSVTLDPIPTAPGWAFSIAGWGGDCAGSGGSATLVMNQNHDCPVAFAPSLTVAVVGGGTLTSSPAGIDCSARNAGSCQQAFPYGSVVTLTNTPASGWGFSQWSGDCTGVTDCVVTMSALHSVGATFLFGTGPATLVIGPKPLVIEVGGRPNLDVVVKDANGNTIPDPTVTFASRNPAVASLSPGGVLNGVARGQSVVVATASGGSAPADSLLALVAVPRGPVVMTDITQFNYAVNTTVTVTLIVDMRDSGELLGSTTVDVAWNPSLLTYQSSANGGSGVSPSVNASKAGSGLLTVAMADPSGFAGRVELVKITFTTSFFFTSAGTLTLTPTEITGAGTFTDLLPQTVAASYPLATVTGSSAAAHAESR